jgi:hypothetical protein
MPIKPKENLDDSTQKLNPIILTPDGKWSIEIQNDQKIIAILGEILQQVKGIEGRLAIMQRTPAPAQSVAPLKREQVCTDWIEDGILRRKGCGAPVRWGKIDGKSKLLNPDGTIHHCGGESQ